MLVARVRSLDADFELSDADVLVALDLCHRLDGLPLAIELAAARVPALGLRSVQARLDDRLRLLTHGVSPQRHATPAGALAWSVSLLDPPLQRLISVLGVFSGSFGLDLALEVGTAAGLAEWAVLDGLGRLVNHSLVVPDLQGDPPRLRLLQTVRAYALDRLHAAGRLLPLRRRHAEAVSTQLARAGLAREEGRLSADQALQGVSAELDNVRAAMDWALAAPERAAVGHSRQRATCGGTWPCSAARWKAAISMRACWRRKADQTQRCG